MAETYKTILLVEDEILIGMETAQMLEGHGYAVVTANSGTRAIEAAHNNPGIDIILMDIDLGRGMDGTEAAAAILRKHDVPVLFVSSHTEMDMVERTEKIASYGYVVKNSGDTVLLASIRMAFRLHDAYTRIKGQREELEHANRRMGSAFDEIEAANEKLLHSQEEIIEGEKALRESEERFRRLFDTMAQGVVYQSADGAIVAANPAAERILGLSLDQMQGRTSTDRRWRAIREDGTDFPGSEHPAMVALRTGSEIRDVMMGVYHPAAGETRWLIINAVPEFRMGESSPYQVYTTLTDITERKRAEEAIQANEELFRKVFEDGSIGMVMINNDKKFFTANAAFCSMLGYTQEEMNARTFLDVTHPEHRKIDRMNVEKMWRGEIPSYRTEKRYIKKNGDVCWANLSATLIRGNDGKPLYALATIYDITERKQSEEALSELNQRLEGIFDNAVTGIVTLDTNRVITSCNPAAVRILGYSREELMGQSLRMIYRSDEYFREVGERAYPAISETGRFTGEVEIMRAGKEARICEISIGRFLRKGEITGIVGVFHDITDRKKAIELLLESREWFHAFMDNNPAIAWAKDEDGRHVFLNRTYEERFGVSLPEWKGKTDFELWPRDIAETFWKNDRIVLAGGGTLAVEEETPEPDGTRTNWLNIKFTFSDPTGKKFVGGIGIDITERKRAEEKIQALLAEKELLIKEVHHRIKNNMAALTSILSLQGKMSSDPATEKALNDVKSRMQSMALLYERLYRSDNVREMPIGNYLPDMINEIASMFHSRPEVAIEKHIDNFILDAKTMSVLGLIVNELMTNAMKHAFEGRDSGNIIVAAAQQDGHASLIIEDNGIGIPESVDIDNSPSFGLRLVGILIRQLDGTITIARKGGTRFTITFPLTV